MEKEFGNYATMNAIVWVVDELTDKLSDGPSLKIKRDWSKRTSPPTTNPEASPQSQLDLLFDKTPGQKVQASFFLSPQMRFANSFTWIKLSSTGVRLFSDTNWLIPPSLAGSSYSLLGVWQTRHCLSCSLCCCRSCQGRRWSVWD